MSDGSGNKPTYHLTTFGCQMNEHDSERIRGVLEERGWTATADPESADLLVFNTCAVRESAESRLLGRLGEARRLKEERPDRLVALGGCFTQMRGRQLFSEIPFVDVAFGPQNIGELPVLLEEAANGQSHAACFEDGPVHSAGLPTIRTSGHRAWVQVMTGCTNYCSYCVVPLVRGPERSRPMVDIINETESLVADGVVEITLLGQNVNTYGLDLEPGAGRGAVGQDFAGLLAALDGVAGLKRIRFTTSHPKDLNRDIIQAMRDLPSVCEHMHLPAQSGSTRILERMKRGYNREHYLDLTAQLYELVPGIALTTDLIVGFPSEKEDDFYRTLTLAQRCRFDGAFTFRFSARPGTEAAGLPGPVPEGTIRRRMRELVSLTQAIAAEKNLALAGSFQEVMVEGESRRGGGQLRGRTRGNKIVNFSVSASTKPAPGALIRVRIESSTSTTLRGTAD